MMAWTWRFWYNDVLPFAALVTAECALVGVNILYKAASLTGLSFYAFIFYSYVFSALFLLPFAFIFRSSAVVPSVKQPLILRIGLLGLIGVLSDVLGYKGLQYSSPTLSSAMGNLIPAFTFTLAVILRMESLDFRSDSTQAKIIGTLVSISGALVVALYKGPTVLSKSRAVLNQSQQPLGSSNSKWTIGGLLLATEYLLFSVWYIIQTQVVKIYPAEFIVVFLFFMCGAIISAPVCFIAEANLSAWGLGPTIAWVAVVYAVLSMDLSLHCELILGFGYGLSTVIHAWGLRIKGPVYIATFKPLSIAIAAIMSFIVLGDPLHLGSIIGAVIISVGFYVVIWGKAKEEKAVEYGSEEKLPLLQG